LKKNFFLNNILNTLTVAVCLTDEDITTGLMDMFATVYAKVLLEQLITENNEKINPIWVNASF